MERITLVVRIILGLLLVVFGLNGFMQFIPLPPPPPEAAAAGAGIAKTIYIMPTVMALLLVTGILILLNRYTALALVILFPLTLNFVLFHSFLDVAGIVPGLLLFVLNLFLMLMNKEKYSGLLKTR